MIRTLTIEPGQKPTQKQLDEVKAAAKKPITFDDDCEELSPAMIKAFECAAIQRNRRKKVE